MSTFYNFSSNTLTINILAKAWAKQDSFWKIVWDRLKISVKKAPENWEATEYLRKFLAKEFWVSLKDCELLYWETSREKAFKITNPTKTPEKIKELNKIIIN